MSSSKVIKLKFLILGSEAVGKTSLKNTIFDNCIFDDDSFINKSYQELTNHNTDIIAIDASPTKTSEKSDLINKRKNDFNFDEKINKDILNESNSTFISDSKDDVNNMSVTKKLKILNNDYLITIIDSECMNSFSILNERNFAEIDGYILMFAINDEISFENINTINEELTNKIGYYMFPRVIIGNKCDLEYSFDEKKIDILKSKLLCPYIECSCEDNKNIDKILYKLVKEINKEEAELHPYDIKNHKFINNNSICSKPIFYKTLLNYLFCFNIVRKFNSSVY